MSYKSKPNKKKSCLTYIHLVAKPHGEELFEVALSLDFFSVYPQDKNPQKYLIVFSGFEFVRMLI